MLLAIGVDAAGKALRFVRMASGAFDGCDFVGVRIAFDVGVAILALENTMNAGTELVFIDADAMAGCILHAGV
jgi:hypothetical protein